MADAAGAIATRVWQGGAQRIGFSSMEDDGSIGFDGARAIVFIGTIGRATNAA
ncbi:hypothetical protein [Burkholderia sp. AU16741]|uniref:hypothetical protein n=1 Tax=Burkholderia sp. AU16741 TaxID=2015347 RepID=UPI0015C5FB08|nr:hypothetical protein [Burkholderia sp. AU16741]